MPHWMFESFIKRSTMLITEEDIALTAEGIDCYMCSEGIILTADVLQFQHKCCEENMYGMKYTAQRLLAGDRIGKELYERNLEIVERLYEDRIIPTLNEAPLSSRQLKKQKNI